MIPDYYDPRKVGALFLEDPARSRRPPPSAPDEDRVKIAEFGHRSIDAIKA